MVQVDQQAKAVLRTEEEATALRAKVSPPLWHAVGGCFWWVCAMASDHLLARGFAVRYTGQTKDGSEILLQTHISSVFHTCASMPLIRESFHARHSWDIWILANIQYLS